MMPKSAIQRCFSIILIVTLAACKTTEPTPSVIVPMEPTPTTKPTLVLATYLPTFSIVTQIPPPTSNIPTLSLPTVSFSSFTSTPGPSLTSAPTKTPSSATPAPTRTPLPFVPLQGLRVAYSIDGDLYVQDSGRPAIQLTRSGHDYGSIFSDDGQKIVFYRGENQLWGINADGDAEQALITSTRLDAFGEIYTNELMQLRTLVFAPGTHQLLFNTHIYRGSFDPPEKNKDLFLVNTDTGELKQLLTPGQGGDFLVSPDGKRIAVQAQDHLDVIDLQGQIVQQNLVNYPVYNPPAKVPMAWMPNSKELIVLPSKFDPLTAGIPVFRKVWRYSVEGGSGVEIQLDPPPIDDAFSISPDGKWIAYSYHPSELDPDAKFGVYLGNLRNGTSQLLFTPPVNERIGFPDPLPLYYEWSPDSVSFSCYYEEVYMGNIRGEFTSLGLIGLRMGEVPAWIDGKHYLLEGGSVLVEVGKQERFRVVDIPPGVIEPSDFVFLGH